MNSPPTCCRRVPGSFSAQIRSRQMFKETSEQGEELLAGQQVFLQPHPGARPAVEVPANSVPSHDVAEAARFILVVLAFTGFHFMLQLITILNRGRRFSAPSGVGDSQHAMGSGGTSTKPARHLPRLTCHAL
jgi:hypothetical protein